MAAHTCNPSTGEAKMGGSWATKKDLVSNTPLQKYDDFSPCETNLPS